MGVVDSIIQIMGDNLASREVTNGWRFFVALFLIGALGRMLAPILLNDPRIWNNDRYVKLAWGLFLVLLGATIQSGWIWLLLLLQNNGYDHAAKVVAAANAATYVAGGLFLWGAACAIKAIALREDGHWYWVLVVTLSLLAPLAIRELL